MTLVVPILSERMGAGLCQFHKCVNDFVQCMRTCEPYGLFFSYEDVSQCIGGLHVPHEYEYKFTPQYVDHGCHDIVFNLDRILPPPPSCDSIIDVDVQGSAHEVVCTYTLRDILADVDGLYVHVLESIVHDMSYEEVQELVNIADGLHGIDSSVPSPSTVQSSSGGVSGGPP